MEIIFKADKKHRDKYFSAGSFAHPAKMMLPLQRWIIEKYSKPGDVILDPMAGCGTVLIACTMGRHVILVELESKFVQMQNDNWAKIQTLGPEMGYEMGMATILQGDARKLPDILADVVISSPPFGEQSSSIPSDEFIKENRRRHNRNFIKGWESGHGQAYSDSPNNIGNLPYGKLADVIMTSPPYEGSDVSQTHMTSDQRGDPSDPNYRPSWKRKLDEGYAKTKRPYADVIMTSPPYAENPGTPSLGSVNKDDWGNEGGDIVKRRGLEKGYSNNPDNLGNLPYGNIDCVITSPPYENTIAEGDAGPLAHGSQDPSFKDKRQGYTEKVDCVITSPPYDEGTGHGRGSGASNEILETKKLYLHGVGSYGESKSNIGNLKGDSYLSAMLEVYQGCWRVLKPRGLMVLVTKNFIREKQEIRLDMDTIKLCEQAGLQFVERHYRKLTSQSFWRTIYQQKYPDAPILDKEDILVFRK